MATIISNTGNITYNYNGQSASANSNTVLTTITDQNSLSAIKTAHMKTYKPGENITYTFLVTNTGQSDLHNITIEDDLGKTGNRLTYLNESAIYTKNGVQIQIDPVAGVPYTFTEAGILHPGESFTLTYVASAPKDFVPSGTVIDNGAVVSARVGSPTGQVITSTPNPEAVVTVTDYADVTISKTSSNPQVSTGQDFDYTFTLTNSGNIEATNIVLTDTLPTNFVINSIISNTNNTQTTYTSADYTLDSSTNTLTLPAGSGTPLNVPPATESSNGITTITINGYIRQTT